MIQPCFSKRPAQLDSAKAAIVGATLLSLDSNARIADALLLARLDGEPVDFVTRQSEAISSVNLAQARRVAKEILVPETMPTVIVRDQTKKAGIESASGQACRNSLSSW